MNEAEESEMDVGADGASPTMTIDREGPDVLQARDSALHAQRRRQYLVRTLSLAIPVAAVWLGMILGPMVAGVLRLLAVGVGIMLGAWVLGAIGFALLAVGNRALAWVRRVPRWPE
jgi:hypothetical protein